MTQRHVGWSMQEGGLSLLIGDQSLTLNKDHPNFDKVKAALKAKDYDAIPGLIDIQQSVREWAGTDPNFKIAGGVVYYREYAFTDAVSEKVLRLIAADFDPQPLFNFLRKVMENPSFTARRELLLFCEANGFLIHEDGDVIAYKSTGENYESIQADRKTGKKVRYMIGDVPEMDRAEVNDNRDVTCAEGLHAAAFDYASTWAGGQIRHVMVVKIDPKDFVSIPSDYSNQKARVCRMEVIGERQDFTPLPKTEIVTSQHLTVRDRVLRLLSELAGRTVQFATDTLRELDFGRMDRVHLCDRLNADFGTEIDRDFFSGDSTVDHVIDVVEKSVARREDEDDEDDDIDCPNCGHPNPPENRYCGQCGAHQGE